MNRRWFLGSALAAIAAPALPSPAPLATDVLRVGDRITIGPRAYYITATSGVLGGDLHMFGDSTIEHWRNR